MEMNRREMMFSVTAAGVLVVTPAVLLAAMDRDKSETVTVAETEVTLRVPVDVMRAAGMRLPNMGDADETRVNNELWYSRVRFYIMGMDYLHDDAERVMYKALVRNMSPYPGVTVPEVETQAVGKRIIDANYNGQGRMACVTYRVWAAPVAVTSWVFGDGTNSADMDGVGVDVRWCTAKMKLIDAHNPWGV